MFLIFSAGLIRMRVLFEGGSLSRIYSMLNCEKCENSRILHILFLIISTRLFKLQRCTIPHFKALDLLFWPLAWLLTLGSIIFAVWSKTFVNFFLLTLYLNSTKCSRSRKRDPSLSLLHASPYINAGQNAFKIFWYMDTGQKMLNLLWFLTFQFKF